MLGIGFGELLVIICVGIFFMKPSQFSSTFKEIKFFIRKFIGIRNELMNEVLNHSDYSNNNNKDNDNDRKKIIIKGIDGSYYEAYEIDSDEQYKYHDIDSDNAKKITDDVRSDLVIDSRRPSVTLDVSANNNI
ncbi:MAG: hypothetical protein OEY79_02065 [Anaplasmataceae bacterium]|nr:hypothetical protein [Anaplasmataceae bacterium]